MRLTTIFLFATCLQVAAASSAQTVTINVKHASAAQVFREIQKQTKLNVMIDVSLLEEVGDLDLNFKHAPIRQVLDKCFEGLPITYTISGNTIVVRSSARKVTDDQQRDKGILIVITGKVTDEEGNPLARVSVYNVNTKTGTITSESGEFELKVSVHDTIRVTYVGYLAQSVIIKPNTSNLKIKLVPSVRKSEEVVVTGYQTIRKSEMVGSASTVKREDLFYDGTNTIEQMLQGKLPGTLVINNSGLVGTRQKVRVRGTSTLLGNQEPVWVVDGIIQEDPIPFKAQELDAYGNITQDNFDMVRTFIGNSISWLNPNDIEDITVLKDASATVLYGVKAANGVIMITTKKGKSGRVS
ncbi:MAG TPA: TonB-dependent receptor plug domain-containing protein, partial [Hanamia sp.]|nr:TonB-dependent receptor plug domain-containing protein [Hanamia sp.]